MNLSQKIALTTYVLIMIVLIVGSAIIIAAL